MLKTRQASTGAFTARLDKTVDQTTFIGRTNKPQYLDVALARDLNADKKRTKVEKPKHVQNGKEFIGIKKGQNNVNVFSGKVANSDRNVNLRSYKQGKQARYDKGQVPVDKPHTFKEKLKFENQKNQKLYQELDRMLAGKNVITSFQKEGPESEHPVKVTKTDPISVVTKSSLYPGISKESRERHNDNLSFGESAVPAKTFLGDDSKILHQRELKAQARLDNLDKLDDFSLGDFTRRTKAVPTDVVKPQPSSSEPVVASQKISVGIPVHAGNTFSRRHIVADIPVYLPTHAGGNQPVQPVVKEIKPVPVDRVYESTIPGPGGKPLQIKEHAAPHAPEAFVGPVLGLNTVAAETRGAGPILNTYRSTTNPISERLLQEQAERERSLLEKEELKYFDVEPGADAVEPGVRNSQESDQKSVAGTLLSDPGPRKLLSFEASTVRLTPDGYAAQRERQARLEKEARILKKAEEKSKGLTAGVQRTSRTEPDRSDNQYQVDFYAHRTRSQIHSATKMDREDSWIKKQLENPAMDTYRGQGGSTYRGGGYGNDTYRGPDTYRAEGPETYRRGDPGTYRVQDNGRHENRSYRLPDTIRGRERYGDPARRDRDDRYDPRREAPYDRRHERESDKLAYSRDERDRREYEKNRQAEREKIEFEKNRQNQERDRRYSDRGREHDERDRKFDERDPRDNGSNRRELKDPQNSKYDRRQLPQEPRRELPQEPRRELPQEPKRELPQEPKRELPQEPRRELPQEPRRELPQEPRSQGTPTYTASNRPGYDRDRYAPRPGEPRVNESSTYKGYNQNEDYRRPEADRANRPAVEQAGGDNKKPTGKVQYVLRNRSSNSKNEMRKSDMSHKSEPLPENVPPSSTELVRDKSPKSQYSRKSIQTADSDYQTRGPPPPYARQAPVGQERPKVPVSEKNDEKQMPTYETKVDKNSEKSPEDLNKYFDEPDKANSPSDSVPVYSDNVNTYSKPKHNFRNGEMMTPVQEMSIRQSEEDDKLSKTDKGSEKGIAADQAEKGDRIKFLSSTENKHAIEEDRRSPWRKGETRTDGKSPSLKDEPPKHLLGMDDIDIRNIKGPDSAENIRERMREKTLEKLEEIKENEKEKSRRERTMDSQGPSDNKDEMRADEIDIDDLDLDKVETEMDERELYVGYLLTDHGEKIGPFKLDIDDVRVGLPNPEKLDDLPEKTGEVENEGMRNRQTGSHGLNEFSSRSHSMLMLTIDSEMQDPDDENLFITKRGKLTFVDLAGSEKVKDSNSTGDSLVESNSINKSLLVLGNCISSLGDQKRRQGHIPYRDSKLTKLLADSLGGNGVTLMICCITPSSYHASETMNTLRYASRAKKIRTKPVIKMDPREKLILSLKREIKVLRNENHYLRQQLEFPAKPRGQLQKENDQKFMKIMKETNEKIKQNGGSAEESGLYEMLQEYMVENEALRTENAEMQVNRDKVRQDQQVLYRDNEKLMRRVDELERRLNQAQANWQTMPRQEGRSRDHSPRGSPQYRGGGSGGRMVQAKFAQPPNDLPLRDNPALWDPIYPGSPPQGYPSPTTNGRAKQPAGPGQPSSGTRGQPMKPPHRLSDTIPPQRPVHEQNGPPYMNGHPPGPMQQPGSSGQYRQAHIGSPNRSNDAIRDMNEKLKQELMQLDGQIHHHQVINQHRTGNSYGSQGSMR